jgi:uncharacterized protein YbjT (DUF2867 family)
MVRVLAIGGTGTVGRNVVAQLSERGEQVAVFARNPDAVMFASQVERVRGDLTIPETLKACLRDIDAVFLTWTAPASAAAPVLELLTKSARRIVFLSAPLKTPHPLFQQPNAGRVLAEKIEHLIESSGCEWTFLRPGMFAPNSLEWWGPQLRLGNIVRWPYLSVPAAPIDERDIAAVAVRALCEEGHAKAEYVMTGPESLTHFEQISTIGRVLGRSLQIEEMSPDEARTELLTIMPPVVIEMLLNAWSAAVGLQAHVTNTVAEITGRRALSFEEWSIDNAAGF